MSYFDELEPGFPGRNDGWPNYKPGYWKGTAFETNEDYFYENAYDYIEKANAEIRRLRAEVERLRATPGDEQG
jgi:hypothetical protein